MPSELGEVILVTLGTFPSTTRFLFADNDPVNPGIGKDKIASLPPSSLIVLPFSDNAVVSV